MTYSNIESLIIGGDKLLIDGIPQAIDKKIMKLLLEVIAKNQQDGKVNISNEVLAAIEDDLYNVIKDSNYTELVNEYMTLFVQADNIISKEQARINNLKAANIEQLWKGSGNRERLLSKVVYDLGSGGVKDIFIKGLADAVRQISYVNMTIDQAVDVLMTKIVDNEYTKRYIRTTAMDSLSQYDGAVNQEVKNVYGFSKYVYIGNSIDTSRAICRHLRDDLGGRFDDDMLRSVLQEYCPDGKPSDDSITIDKKKYKKGGGMIEGTVFDNFMQLRGGYGCRHRCLSTK